MPAIPKATFIKFFGGNRQTYNDWSDDLGFPWQKTREEGESFRQADTPLDLKKILEWYYGNIVALRRAGTRNSGTKHSPDAWNADERKKVAQADLAELKVLESKRQLIPIEEVIEDFQIVSDKVRQGIDLLRRNHPEAADIMEGKINEAKKEFEERTQ